MIGAVGVAFLAAALVLRIPALVTPGLAMLGAEYAGLFVVRGDTLDVRAPLYGAAFLVVAELSFAALELRAGRPEPGLVPRRVAVVVGAAAAGVIVGLIVLAAAATPLNGGLGLEAAGIVAAVVLVVCARPRGGAVAMTVAVVGSLSLDFVDGGAPRVGGAPFYAARALRALGASAVIAAKCAAPDRHLLLPPLIRLGLPVRWQDSSVSAAFSFTYEREQRRMSIEAIADPWSPAEAVAAVGDARWVQVAPLSRADFPAETLAALARGRRLLLDGQGLARPARIGPLELDADYDPAVLRSVSVLKLSADEAELLVDGYGEQALGRLGVKEVVVTLGSRGCIVFADGVAELVRAHPVAAADPTGAGDAFAAAYVVARSGGAAPTAAARRAAALVSDLLAGRAA